MIDKEKIKKAVIDILEAIGENPNREGLIGTPDRVARMYEEIYSGNFNDPKEHLKVKFEDENHEEMVLVKDINFYSCCEHHLVPFFGKVHIAYIPKNGVITGLSKLARVVEVVSKRLQLQERLTKSILEAINEELNPLGVFVLVEAEHLCMSMRGVKKPGSKTITISSSGVFDTDREKRNEVINLINMK